GDRVARGVPLARGREARFWELPMCFELDDWVHFQFNFDPYRKGGAPPSHVLEVWRAEFDWMDAHVDGGVLTICMHPQVIGRGHRIAMLDELIGHCLAAGARFERMGDVAARLGSLCGSPLNRPTAAPVGSVITANRPMPSMSSGPMTTPAPRSWAFENDASTSSTPR